ncbi:MAG: hypothetical protein ACR2FJ_02600, partial [Qipengyuania sp.]
LGSWDKPDNNLLRFLLQQRLPDRYGARGGAATGTSGGGVPGGGVPGGGIGAGARPGAAPAPAVFGTADDDEWIDKINLQFERLRRKAILCGEIEPTESERRDIERDKTAFFAIC